MSLCPVLIAGEWRAAKNPVGSFAAEDPAQKKMLPETYPVSGAEDAEAALVAGSAAALELAKASPDVIARFLELCAEGIEARANDLIRVAASETGLPAEPRLKSVELPRTTNQLRQAAKAARERSWCRATIDTKLNLRSRLAPLGGPVAVLGPNNFPYAFNGVAGGDFAAAVAAGNPVIAKANPGHPGTTRLLAEVAIEALAGSGLPRATLQLIYHLPEELGHVLVAHPLLGATAFTGSRRAGLALKESADRAGKPIYLEMSSVNPVFFLPGALRERGPALAAELSSSCSLGAGQFCTNPGIGAVVAGPESEVLIAELARAFAGGTPGVLLGRNVPKAIARSLEVLVAHGAEILCGGKEVDGSEYRFESTLLRVSGDAFVAHPGPLQTEAFGPVHLVVVARDAAQLVAIAALFEGNLTGSIYAHSGTDDDALYTELEPVLRPRVGRLLNDKMPTGVAVSAAMSHGGPYPATGHPGFTSVGIPASLTRFARLESYDAVRPARLPAELRDANPTGSMWRLIDGVWSERDVVAAG
jgi:NADP-dependent aldehyde dehydrogenase